MTIKKNVIAVIIAAIAVLLILFSLFNSSVLICGTWEKTLTKEETIAYEEETGSKYKSSEHTVSFDLSGIMTTKDLDQTVKTNYVVNTTNSDTLLSYTKEDNSCLLIKVKDGTLTTYEYWSDYFDGVGTEYKRVGFFSFAWVLRIIGIVVLGGAVAVFFLVKDIKIAVSAAVKKYIISGAMAAVAIVLVVMTFVSTTVMLCGTWVLDMNKEEIEQFEADYMLEFKEKNFTTSYNIFSTSYEKFGEAMTGYNYMIDGDDFYTIMLADNDETKGYDYDGGMIEKKKMSVGEGSLYLYDEGQKPAEGEKYKRVGVSLAWLMRIVAILLVGGAVAVYMLYKPEQELDPNAPVEETVVNNN